MTTLVRGSDTLTRDALTVLQPGFVGTTAPDWLLRRIGEGLSSVGLFGRNVVSPEQLARLTAQLRAEREDVLVAIDEEGGDVTRLEVNEGSSFPGNYALGRVDDVELTRAVARELGRRLIACGIDLNWAPSADVNSNAENPVIGVRSFGPDPDLVARHTVAYVDGLQAVGVAACTKHFPGHGDTNVDSHDALPRIDVDLATLHARELVPFRAAIAAGTKAVMSAHILLSALDTERPATLSPQILTGLLRQELGFDGLIVTDGMEMQAVAATYGIERGSVLAIAAGADAICVGGGLCDEDTVLRLRDALVDAVRTGELPEERLADAAARVRALAAWTQAHRARGAGSGGGGAPARGGPPPPPPPPPPTPRRPRRATNRAAGSTPEARARRGARPPGPGGGGGGRGGGGGCAGGDRARHRHRTRGGPQGPADHQGGRALHPRVERSLRRVLHAGRQLRRRRRDPVGRRRRAGPAAAGHRVRFLRRRGHGRVRARGGGGAADRRGRP
ncbi:glycoside hydrolase family 3 protein [Streptomyces sp. NPDC058527]|uniref:glycoside hydrolase family 3 protein n=1 Tax=Streptomyces sp. NPDC058527 TaxID=3346539 RepID=UPI00364F0132